MPFIGELKYEKIPDKESFVGRPVYKLLQPFEYSSDEYKPYEPIYCETGFKTDFASIPEWLFFLRPNNGKWKKAAVIHDKACLLAKEGGMSYKEADIYFYYALKDDGASWFTTNLFYFWVRLHHIIANKK